jgi:hypothetical protein
MKSGFSHFDGSHRENFLASVLLLAMESEDVVRDVVARLVRERLGIAEAYPVTGLSREVRLATTEDGKYARADLCLDFDSPRGPFCAFIEVKTHQGWDGGHVAHQVADQASRTPARVPRDARGSILLAPERVCRWVASLDPTVRTIPWRQLINELRALPSTSPLTKLAIQHLEENVDRAAGLDRPMTLAHFEQATTTVACLREFLVDCAADIGGAVHGEPIYLTPGDGKPRRGSGWAWHGLSVPFSVGGQKGRIGIYKYADAPPGEQAALDTLWLETYLGDGEMPVAWVKFAPPTLAAKELDAVRADLGDAWKKRAPVPSRDT